MLLMEIKVQKYIFQQDNAPFHRAKNTLKWVENDEIINMGRPALVQVSIQLKNIRSDISKMIYCNGKQYDAIQELNTAILVACASLPE